MLLNCDAGEDSWESLRLQGDSTSPSYIQEIFRKSVLSVHWNDWCWSWNSNPLAMWFEELTHWKRPWCWEGLGAGGEGDDRGWDGWMASPTQWTWVWTNSGRWWWTGRPGVLQPMGSQIRSWLSDWTELNWNVQNLMCQLPLRKSQKNDGRSHQTFVFLNRGPQPPGSNAWFELELI